MIRPREWQHVVHLRRLLAERFDEDGLKTLCFDLQIDYENLPALGKAGKARELVDYCARHERLPDLVACGQRERPDIEWAIVAEPDAALELAPLDGDQALPPGEGQVAATYLIEDFVNREQQLAIIWSAVRQASGHRVLLLSGADGMGKTYLLDECREECKAQAIDHVWLDLADSALVGAVAVIRTIAQALGPEGFAPLEQLQADTHVLSRDLQRDDPAVQEEVHARLTAVCRDCLSQRATERPVVFFIDNWERSTQEIADWLCQALLVWILEKTLPTAVALLAGTSLPALHRLASRIRRLELNTLPPEAVQLYWVGRRGLPVEDVPHIIAYSGCRPNVVALLADVKAQQLGPLG